MNKDLAFEIKSFLSQLSYDISELTKAKNDSDYIFHLRSLFQEAGYMRKVLARKGSKRLLKGVFGEPDCRLDGEFYCAVYSVEDELHKILTQYSDLEKSHPEVFNLLKKSAKALGEV